MGQAEDFGLSSRQSGNQCSHFRFRFFQHGIFFVPRTLARQERRIEFGKRIAFRSGACGLANLLELQRYPSLTFVVMFKNERA